LALDALSEVRQTPGVYLLVDLDGEAAYVGQSGKLRTRLIQHFVRQDSSVTSDGLLDVYEVWKIKGWYVPPASLDEQGGVLFTAFQPRWNRRRLLSAPLAPNGDLPVPDFEIALIDETDLEVRRVPLQRIENKLLHLVRATRKARISGASSSVKRALGLHASELQRLFGVFADDL